MTTTLYGWGPMFDCPSPSPFVMKTEIQLQMLGIDFDRAIADLESVPKHRAPYVRDDGKLIEDSNFIRAYFEKKTGQTLDSGLSDRDRATAWALERMAEDHLIKTVGIERWLKNDNFNKGPVQLFAGVPEPMRESVCRETRERVAATMRAVGFGLHSEEERMQLASRDLNAIALQLGDRPYLFGAKPTAPDAAVSSAVISAATEFFDGPLAGLVRRHENLMGYIDRIKSEFFAQNLWPAL